MPLRFYNTLTQEVSEFTPQRDNTVRMYTCGPTVYDYAHIGNFRTFTFVDILRRWLRASGFQLDHVMNITDVDDKIIRNAAAQRKSLGEYTAHYKQAFLDDCALLRLERPEHTVAATEHIHHMADAIERLTAGGHTYHGGGQPNAYASVATKLDSIYKPQGKHVYFCNDVYKTANDAFDAYLKTQNMPVSSHAGIPDTSEMLYLGADLGWVRAELVPTAVQGPDREHANGISGDARPSTKELGRKIFDMKVDYAVKQIQAMVGQR